MWLYQTMLAVAMLFAIGGWLKGRPKGWIFPSDAFFLMTLLVAGIVPFANLRARSQDLLSFSFSDDAIFSALTALSIMYLIFGIVWWMRPSIRVSVLVPRKPNREVMWQQVMPYAFFGAALFLFITFAALVYPPYLQFKVDVFRFVTGRIDPESYQIARRVTFVDDTFIGGAIGRLRYSILPIGFLSVMFFVMRWRGLPTCVACALGLIIVGPASLAKAVIVVFLGYFSIAYMLERGYLWVFRARNAIISIMIAVPTLLVLLTILYFFQYRTLYVGLGDIPEALSVAYFRLFVATYQGLLQYFSTYPDTSGFAGVSSISFAAPLFGEKTRLLDQEVSIHFLGPQRGLLTTFPTIFIGNAYASFGYFGVAIFSFLVAIFLAFIDWWVVCIRNRYMRIAYLSSMLINSLFFAVLAAPAALVTYGCAIIPIIILICDRLVQETARRKHAAAIGRRKALRIKKANMLQ